jgi:hypothetical protein
VRLLTGAGLIDAAVVKVDAANDLALLKAVGRFAPLPIAASRTVKLGGTVATVGFPIQDFMRKPGNQEKEFIHGFLDSLFLLAYLIISRSACRCSRGLGRRPPSGRGAGARLFSEPLTPTLSPPRGEGENNSASLTLAARTIVFGLATAVIASCCLPFH